MKLKNWPTQSHRISSPFGYRIHPITGNRTMHNGIDIGRFKASGEPIMAVADGRVTASYHNQYRGWVVLIDHGGWQSLYQHLTKQGAAVNTLVKAGQLVGQMGNTGASAGVHLHFELRDHGQCVDPVPYLNNMEEDNMTEIEVKAIVREVLAESRPDPSAWAVNWEDAKRRGITDGTNPHAYPTREQTIEMIMRAIKK